MNLYSPTLTPNFDLPWPLRPLCDLLDIFFQLQNIQLNRFINGTPWYMAKTCATGFQNLGCYAAKTTFHFIEEPIVDRQSPITDIACTAETDRTKNFEVYNTDTIYWDFEPRMLWHEQ